MYIIMNNTPIDTIGLKSLLLSNLTNPKFKLSETHVRWITKLMLRSPDMLVNIHVHIQPYQNKKIEICYLDIQNLIVI